MPDQRLRETLSNLQAELSDHPELDGETTAMLSNVLADITQLLDDRSAAGSSGQGDPDDTLANRLATATNDFEATHPRLTTAVTQLAEALAAMGI